MSFVPYTTVALTRIRHGATAKELGWDEVFYRSVCRKHSITPNLQPSKTQDSSGFAEIPTDDTIPQDSPGAVYMSQPITPVRAASELRGVAAAPELIEFNETNGALRRGAASVKIKPRVLVRMLALLAKARAADGLHAPRLYHAVNISDSTGKIYLSSLRTLLCRVGLTIPRAKRNNAPPLCIIDITTLKPVAISIVGEAAP